MALQAAAMTIRKNKILLLVMVLACAGLAWFCNYLPTPSKPPALFIAKATFAQWIFIILAAFSFISLVFGRSVVAVIAPEGLSLPGFSDMLFPWHDIASIKTYRYGTSDIMAFRFTLTSTAARSITFRAKVSKAIYAMLGVEGYPLPLNLTGVDGREFMFEVESAMRAGAAQRGAAPGPVAPPFPGLPLAPEAAAPVQPIVATTPPRARPAFGRRT